MFDNFEGRVIIVDGTDIAFVIGGSGPPLLMLHGFPQNKTMWARVAPLLTDHFTVVCADLRGYGDSAKPVCLPDRSNYSFRALADDQVGLMRKLGFERFHVVGHDRGGRTGHRMALDYPDYFYETCLFGWGTAKVSDFDTEMLADYRRAWRDPYSVRRDPLAGTEPDSFQKGRKIRFIVGIHGRQAVVNLPRLGPLARRAARQR